MRQRREKRATPAVVERKRNAKCVAEIGVFFRDAQLPLGKAVRELLLVLGRKAVGRTSRNFYLNFFLL